MSGLAKRLALGGFLLISSGALLYPPGRDSAPTPSANLGASQMLSALQPVDGRAPAEEATIFDLPPAEDAFQAAAGSIGAARTTTVRMLVTAYCPCRKCCGRFSDGVTASGKSVHANSSMFVAADTRLLPFGTKLSVPGYHQGVPVPVLDRGRTIKGRRLDVFFLSHSRAKTWGKRWVDVTVYLH